MLNLIGLITTFILAQLLGLSVAFANSDLPVQSDSIALRNFIKISRSPDDYIKIRDILNLTQDKKVVLPYRELDKEGSSFEKMEWHIDTSFSRGRCPGGNESIVTSGVEKKTWGGNCDYKGDSSSTIVSGAYSVNSSRRGIFNPYNRYYTITGTRLKGGFADRGDENQTAKISFNIQGRTTLKACNNIKKCAIFVKVERKFLKDIPRYSPNFPRTKPEGSYEQVIVNDKVLHEGESIIIDRSENDVIIKIVSSRNAQHNGACCTQSPGQSGARVDVEFLTSIHRKFTRGERKLSFRATTFLNFLRRPLLQKNGRHNDVASNIISIEKDEESTIESRFFSVLSGLYLLYDYTEKSQKSEPNKKRMINLYQQYLSNTIHNKFLRYFEDRLKEEEKLLASYPEKTIRRLIKNIKNNEYEQEALEEFLNDIISLSQKNPLIEKKVMNFIYQLNNSENETELTIEFLTSLDKSVLSFSSELKNKIDTLKEIVTQIKDDY